MNLESQTSLNIILDLIGLCQDFATLEPGFKAKDL
jgi:hypothetical protein